MFVKVPDMSDWAIHLFVLGLGISVMLGLSRALRRVARRRSLTQDDVVLVDSITQNVAQGVYVVLSITFALVLATANGVSDNVITEAGQIKSLDQLLAFEATPQSEQARIVLRSYTQSIIEDEWPQLPYKNGSTATKLKLDALLSSIQNLRPESIQQFVLLPEIVRATQALDRSRDKRIVDSQSALPGLFWFISGISILGLIVVSALRLMEATWPSVVVNVVQLMMVGALFSALMILNAPFSGSTRTSPDAIVHALQMLNSAHGPK